MSIKIENLTNPNAALSDGDKYKEIHDSGLVRLRTFSENVEQDSRYVDTVRFKNSLLGLSVYGGLRVARVGLRAKFSNNLASDEEVGYLAVLEAADGILTAPTVNLLDPAVSLVLDFAIANPYISFTEEDKARVISNTAIS